MSTGVDATRIAFDEASQNTLKIIIATILCGVALDTRLSDFADALRRPRAILVGVGAQFVLLPPLTLLLTLALHVRGSMALGMILVACCPPGNVSNVLTHRAKGDTALSVTMTALSNALAAIFLPLNFALWAGMHPAGKKFLTDIDVSAGAMLGDIALIIGVPMAIGLLVAWRWPGFAAQLKPWVSRLGFLALTLIIVAGIASNWDVFIHHIGTVFFAVLIHSGLALLLGYRLGAWAGLPVASRRSVAFEVGVRNSGLGLLIVFTYFDGLGGMALVAAWWGIWDIITGLVLARRWSGRQAPELVTTG